MYPSVESRTFVGSYSGYSTGARSTPKRKHSDTDPERNDFDPADVINGIRLLYKVHEGWLVPFAWCEDFHFHLDNIFTRLKVVRREKTRGTATGNIVDMSGIFKPHKECPQPRTVLIEGKSGMGKTTYCKKMVYDWATRKQEAEDCFPRFETVLLLKCRYMKSNLWEAIDDQLLHRDVGEDVRERFFKYIRQNQSNVLLVLDGLDEVPIGYFPVLGEILQGRVLPKCHVLATTFHNTRIREHFDTLLEIEGFAEKDAAEFIFKYFKNMKNLAEALISKVRSDEHLRDLMANPLNTALLCIICEEFQGIFPESRAQLYEEIIQCFLRRYRRKNGLPETIEDLIDVYGTQLRHLGRVALNGLLEGNLGFDESELESHVGELYLPGFAFLSVQIGGSKLRPRRYFSFQHKSFQEFFAAFYLCSLLLNEDISIDSIVTDRRYFHELKEVILFLFGMLAARKRETAIALVKTATTKLNQEVKTDGDDILCVLQECIKECSKDQRKLVTKMADIFGSVLKAESPSLASLAESLEQWMENDLEGVPPEIAVRGRSALEAYKKALADGKTFDRRVPVMLIGRDRSGKTSLKKSLRGELFNPGEGSTVGIEVDLSHFELSTEIWTMPEKDQEPNSGSSISYEHHVARATVEHMTQTRRAHVSEEKTPEAMPSEHVPAVDTVSASTTIGTHDPAEVGTVSFSSLETSIQEIQENRSDGTSNDSNGLQMMSNESVQTSRHAENEDTKPHIPDDVQTAMIKFLENNSKVEDEEVHAVLWDFAGQSVYYTTHPIFLTPRAIYLLAYDLSKNPHEKARPIPRQGLFQEFTDSCGLEFNSDYLDFWMSSVASLASPEEADQVSSESKVLPDKLPAVFLVCTHADTPYDSLRDPKTLANELYGSLQNKPYNMHLCNVFVVDNTKSGRGSECPGVKHLREELRTVAKQLPQMKEPIPIKWLNYEEKLQAKKKLKEWIDLHEAKRIASEECNIVDEREFRTVLNFLHDKRILIHFSDTPELDKLVVLDPQWLVDVFKKVITIPPYDSKEKEFKQLWCKLQRKGILEKKLLHHVWGTLSFDKETTENLLEIMEKFSLICSWPSSDASCGNQYLMPSMLTTYPPEDIMRLVEAASAQVPSLFVKFESGVVPPGLFPRLVLLFLQWGKENSLNPVKPLLYHNFARCFISEDTSQSVVLRCLSSSIKVVVHRGNDIQESGAECSMMSGSVDVFAGSVCRQLGLILESMRKEFCWLKNMSYKLSFICPVCCQGGVVGRCDTHWVEGCKKEECLHFLSLSELCSKKAIDCNESAGAPVTRVDKRQFAPWLASTGYQLTADEHNGESLANLEDYVLERKEIALPGELQKSLLSQSCGAKDVVLQLKETKQLDQASLENPDLETRTLIRCFVRKAKDSNRLDVVQHLRKITPAGTTGPLLPEQLNVREIPVSKRRDLTIDLSGGEEWKEVAERLGLTPREIRFLDNRTLNPFDSALAFIAMQGNITVADLYELLTECGYPVIADLL